MSAADTLKRLLGWPLRRALDPRVQMTVHEIDARLGSEHLARPTIHDRLDDLDRMGRDMLAGLGWRDVPQPGGDLRALDAPRAAYLNWAGGPDGYAAQAGLWFNPPVPVHHTASGVEVLLVNERIVEQPFVFGAIASAFATPARILDVGGSESTVGLSLATLGHDVTIVDPRAQPLRHRNLSHASCRLDELPADGEPFDAAVVLSAVEHFGLEHYGVGGTDERLDLAALRTLRELVRPGGLLVLTVPFAAQPSVDDFQHVYDEDGLAELLRGWTIETSLRAGRVDRLTWELGEPSRERHGVALVTARRPS
ncbi:MAG TPA: methyltransferase domain-containing protein [Solirubrobacteraceae bacterium]|nr:methyltransferase domain-containing protein [Solirubrobacteraceae bacterium]